MPETESDITFYHARNFDIFEVFLIGEQSKGSNFLAFNISAHGKYITGLILMFLLGTQNAKYRPYILHLSPKKGVFINKLTIIYSREEISNQ